MNKIVCLMLVLFALPAMGREEILCDNFEEAKDHTYMGRVTLDLPKLGLNESQTLELQFSSSFPDLEPSDEVSYKLRVLRVKEGVGLSEVTVRDNKTGFEATGWVQEANSIVSRTTRLNARLQKNSKYVGFQASCLIRDKE